MATTQQPDIAANPSIGGSVRNPEVQEITTERITFPSGGETLVGTLYRPPGDRPSARLPAVVVTGAWMTVKEQMPGRYAREMAERGFAALAFDFRNWGESGGAERQKEDPAAKIEDIRAAVAYLSTRPDVDADRIAGLGICASAGYMATAATRTPELRAIALVAPWLHDHSIVEEVYGGARAVADLIRTGREAEDRYRRTGEMMLVPAASTTDRSALMFDAPYYTESDRGRIPEWRNEVNLAFWEGWLTFDGISAAREIRQPVLMVHSEAAAIPQGARRFYAGLTAPKSDLWLDDITQFDFYDQAEPVRRASDAVAAHLRLALEASASPEIPKTTADA